MSSDLQTGPLLPADPDAEIHAGPLQPTPDHQPRRTSREKRWQRQRRRKVGEEIVGWIVVPIILAACYWAVKSGLSAVGTSPTALIQGIKQAVSSRGGG